MLLLKCFHSLLPICVTVLTFSTKNFQTYFEDNPTDLQVLRHDKALHTVRVQRHLADVPEYIIPSTLKSLAGITKSKKRKRNFSDNAPNKFEVK